MKNPRRFRIPLRWYGTEHIITRRANEMVVPFGTGGLPLYSRSFENVVRLGTEGGKAKYEIAISTWDKVVVYAAKLEGMPVGNHVLIEQDFEEERPYIASVQGVMHRVKHLTYHNYSYRTDPQQSQETQVTTFCGKMRSDYTYRFPVTFGEVECRECLRVKSAWFHYVIEPYTHPTDIEKMEAKQRAQARRKERSPTAYDHLLARDPFVDPPSPPPAPPPPVVPGRVLPGTRSNREDRLAAERRGASYAEQKAAILRKIRGH